MSLTEDDAIAASDFMEANAHNAAQAKANRLHLIEYRKSLKSMLMNERQLEPLGAQERYAYSHKRYLDHLEAMKEAIYQDEKMQWEMESKKSKIEVWRSLNANLRPRL